MSCQCHAQFDWLPYYDADDCRCGGPAPGAGLGDVFGGLGGILAANTKFRLGFAAHIDGVPDLINLAAGERTEQRALEALMACLYDAQTATGDRPFDEIRVYRSQSGEWVSRYYVIEGVTNIAFGQPDHLGYIIKSAVRGCRANVNISSWDNLAIDAIPPQYVGQPDVAQTTTPTNTSNQRSSGGSLFDYFGGGTQTRTPSGGGSIFDDLAGWLGVTPTQAGIAGVVITLAGVVLIKRLL